MPSIHGWKRILRQFPDAVAYAVDPSGMQAAFDTEPLFHPTGRWIASAGGKRVNLGLIDTGGMRQSTDCLGTLQWRPGYTPLGTRDELQAQLDGRPTLKHLAATPTDPKVAGPDAPGYPVDNEGLEQKIGAYALGMQDELAPARPEVPPEAVPGAVIPPTPAAAEPESLAETLDEAECIRKAIVAIYDKLPKTKRTLDELIDPLR